MLANARQPTTRLGIAPDAFSELCAGGAFHTELNSLTASSLRELAAANVTDLREALCAKLYPRHHARQGGGGGSGVGSVCQMGSFGVDEAQPQARLELVRAGGCADK